MPDRDIASPFGDGQAENIFFGDRLRAEATRQGLSAAALAQKLGVTRGTMARYWHGERIPPAAVLLDLAEAIDADPQWLVRGRASPERRHLVAADEADWVDVPEYALLEIDERGKCDPISTTRLRRDWLYTSLGENSGLWIGRLPAPFDALSLGTGAALFCKDVSQGDRMIDGAFYLFRINGGVLMSRFRLRAGIMHAGDRLGEDVVFQHEMGVEEDQYQPVARVIGQLARPI